MSILPEDAGQNVKYAWLGFLETVYNLSGLQRLLVFGGLIILIPGFFFVRFATGYIFGKYYDSKAAYASTSFLSPTEIQSGDFRVLPIQGGYTAYIEIVNPNFELSASKINYTASFFDSKSTKVLEKVGETWLEPSGRRTVVIPRFFSETDIVRGSMSFTGVKWQRKVDYPKVELSVVDPVVFAMPGGGVRFEGEMQNKSPFNLAYARVLLFIYNRKSEVIGVVERYEFSLKPGERRAYILNFTDINPLEIYRVEARVDTNAFDPENITAGQSAGLGGQDLR